MIQKKAIVCLDLELFSEFLNKDKKDCKVIQSFFVDINDAMNECASRLEEHDNLSDDRIVFQPDKNWWYLSIRKMRFATSKPRSQSKSDGLRIYYLLICIRSDWELPEYTLSPIYAYFRRDAESSEEAKRIVIERLKYLEDE